jgi:hypothetical protein
MIAAIGIFRQLPLLLPLYPCLAPGLDGNQKPYSVQIQILLVSVENPSSR